MKLFIDNREPQQIIKYINGLNDMAKVKMVIEVKRLDVGDYILFDEEKNKNLIIIERKSLQDLESSIKDGRYNEQSFRLNQSITHNHNIIYLIEGNIINHRNQNFKSTLYSSLFSNILNTKLSPSQMVVSFWVMSTIKISNTMLS